MPEELDQNPDGEHFKVDRGENDQPEQQEQEPDAVVTPIEIVTPETGLADKPDEGEWDPELAKAAVMGNVLASDRSMKHNYVDRHAEQFGQDSLERRKAKTLEDINKYREDDGEEALDQLPDADVEWVEKNLARERKESYQRANERLEPFEELYDANPDRFTSMPVAEFVKLAHALSLETRALEKIASEMHDNERTLTAVLEGNEAKKPLDRGMLDYLAERYSVNAGWLAARESRHYDDDAHDAAEKEFNKIIDTNRYEKSPRQIAEEVIELFKKQQEGFEELRADRESKKQAIISGGESSGEN